MDPGILPGIRICFHCCEEPLKGLLISEDLPEADVSITGCEALIARTGSILMSSAQESGRTVSVYAPVHICIAYTRSAGL